MVRLAETVAAEEAGQGGDRRPTPAAGGDKARAKGAAAGPVPIIAFDAQSFADANPKLACGPGAPRGACRARALARWPRLPATALARAGDDPKRLARLIARRTALSFEVILGILLEGNPPLQRPSS